MSFRPVELPFIVVFQGLSRFLGMDHLARGMKSCWTFLCNSLLIVRSAVCQDWQHLFSSSQGL